MFASRGSRLLDNWVEAELNVMNEVLSIKKKFSASHYAGEPPALPAKDFLYLNHLCQSAKSVDVLSVFSDV